MSAGQKVGPPIHDDARSLLRRFEHDCAALRSDLDREGLGDLEASGYEKAIHLASIVAASDNPREPAIAARHAEWAIDCVRCCTARMVDAVRARMYGAELAASSAPILECIRSANDGKGRTQRDLFVYCRTYKALNVDQRANVLRTLASQGRIARVEVRPKKGGVAARLAFVALNGGED